jgi:hypothetical protein
MNVLDKFKGQIIDFVKLYGEPKEFSYDTNEGLLNYKDFMGMNSNNDKGFDPSIVHTMLPGKTKQFMQMQNGMDKAQFGSRSPNYLDAKSRALVSTSEGFSVWLNKLESTS